jgi:hypothetical protein
MNCKNCDAPLLGRYCVNCSQAADVHVPSTKELFHELLEGLTHSDSRLWRTLYALWFKPGKLTQEFIAGRRVAYLPPFRLYLIVSILFFLIASFLHTRVQLIQFDNTASPGLRQVTSCSDLNIGFFSARWNQRFKHACDEVVRDNGGHNTMQIVAATAPKAMFLFLPLIAFLHMLFYWRPRHRYAEDLLFLVHLHAFFFSLAILYVLSLEAAESWPSFKPASNSLGTVLGWWAFLYSVVAMRRVFQRSWIGTFFKACALFLLYTVLLGATVAAVFVYAALQL